MRVLVKIFFAAIGFLAAVLLLQQFIILTREPMRVLCDGGGRA